MLGVGRVSGAVWWNWSRDLSSRSRQHLYMHDDREERSRDQFEIPFRHQGVSLMVDFLAKKRELTKKTFTTPLTSPNPNIYVKLHFPVEFPFKNNDWSELLHSHVLYER